ncbi:MAG: DUF6512 family protein [Lachnospiraceae bacterium]|nr:DUF6512 family protein [Lachnospiraceae bacterium]
MQVYKKYILSYMFVCILGVLLHFTYEWSGYNPVVGFFSSINESTWEHLKLLFFPMLILTIFQAPRSTKKDSGWLCSRTLGMLSGMGFIIVAFYTLWGITGRLIDIINIALYFVGVFFAFLAQEKVSKEIISLGTSTCIAIWIGLTVLFIIFTVHIPNLGLFYDLQLHPKSI